MSALSVQLLGKFTAYTSSKSTVTGLEPRKVQELLSYLLIHRQQPQHRETLAGLLWGETTTAQSRANLRKALWQLHSALEIYFENGTPQLLDIQGDWLQIHPEVDLWLDIAQLECAYDASKSQNGAELSPSVATAVEEAVALYRSDLLDGWYQDWCIFERERLQSVYLSLIDKLMGYCEVNACYEKGLTYGAKALRYDQTREQIHRRMMRLHFLSGDRSAAIRQYDRCNAILHNELAIDPAEQTTTLLNQIRQNTLGPANNAVALSAAVELAEIHTMLRKLQGTLSAAQAQVREQLDIVEQFLSK